MYCLCSNFVHLLRLVIDNTFVLCPTSPTSTSCLKLFHVNLDLRRCATIVSPMLSTKPMMIRPAGRLYGNTSLCRIIHKGGPRIPPLGVQYDFCSTSESQHRSLSIKKLSMVRTKCLCPSLARFKVFFTTSFISIHTVGMWL